MKSDCRTKVKLEGIPIVWHTNLSDEDIRHFYAILQDDPDLPNCKVAVNISLPIRISTPAVFSKAIPYKEGWCQCCGFIDVLQVIYRSTKDWELWDARLREIKELREDQRRQFAVNKLLFKVEDAFFGATYEGCDPKR